MNSFPIVTYPVSGTDGYEVIVATTASMQSLTAAKYEACKASAALLMNTDAAATIELRFDAPGASWTSNAGNAYYLRPLTFICLQSLNDIKNLRIKSSTVSPRLQVFYRTTNPPS